MGRERNSYDDQAKRLGYEEAGVKIQERYLDGRRDEATAAVPDQPEALRTLAELVP